MLIQMPTITELALAVTAQRLSRSSEDSADMLTVSKIKCASKELEGFVESLNFVNALMKKPDFEAPYSDITLLKRYIEPSYYTELSELISNSRVNFYVWAMLRLALVTYELPSSTMCDGNNAADAAQDFLDTLFPLLQDDDWCEADACLDGFLETSELTERIERWEWDAIEWVIRPSVFGRRHNMLIEDKARALGRSVKRERLTLGSLCF
jgi:hypothetical protein